MRESPAALCLLFLCRQWIARTGIRPVPMFWPVLWMIWMTFSIQKAEGWNEQLALIICFPVCALAFVQDLYDGWFSSAWLAGACLMAAGGMLKGGCALFESLFGLLWCIPAACSVWKGWMGMADLPAIAAAGWMLGWERMNGCMLSACLIGLVCCAVSKKRRQPFLCFLSVSLILWMVHGDGMLLAMEAVKEQVILRLAQ